MKTRLFLFVLINIMLLSGCAATEDAGQEVLDQVSNVIQATDEHVQFVKNGYPAEYEGYSYGDAFDAFFSSPTWKYFEANTGEDVVEFTGYCTYMDEEVKARFQFILDMDGGTFEAGALSFNDVPQNNLIKVALIQKAFEYYMSNNQPVYQEEKSTVEENGDFTAALQHDAWKLIDIGSWYSGLTGYYLIPFIDDFGNPAIQVTVENNTYEYATAYYVDCVGAKKMANGEMIYNGILWEACNNPIEAGEIKIVWDGLEIKSVDVYNSPAEIASNDYVYYGELEY